MAPPANGGKLKGFYRQRKKKQTAAAGRMGVSKHQTTLADDVVLSEEIELELRRFDMDMAYGPCIGIARLRRWERAAAMGLNPPTRLHDLIIQQQHALEIKAVDGNNRGISLECLWAGKV